MSWFRGSCVFTNAYIMIKTYLPEEFRYFEVAKELEEVGLDPGKTCLVCVAFNIPETVTGAGRYPEIQIVMIPFQAHQQEAANHLS